MWLPRSLLQLDRRAQLVDALIAATRHWSVELHFQKALAGAPAEVRPEDLSGRMAATEDHERFSRQMPLQTNCAAS